MIFVFPVATFIALSPVPRSEKRGSTLSAFYGSIEAGGTKWACAVGSGPHDLEETTLFPTATPDETLALVVEYFRSQLRRRTLEAIGIGCFGPLDLDKRSPTYGYIKGTPKRGWQETDLLGRLRRELGLPLALDTDTNAALLGEHHLGAARGLRDCLYLTVGTGVGGGILANGEIVHGFSHPEMGHIRVSRGPADQFPGTCPFHCDCLEGLASGPAIQQRWGVTAESLPDNHPAWELQAHYVAAALANYICTLAPQRIILGGGVMRQKTLLPLIRDSVRHLLGDYFPSIAGRLDDYIVAPKLGDQAGLCGAFELARLLGNEEQSSFS